MLWALLLGYWLFGELPDRLVYLGATIVTGAGPFVIWRERQLGLQRARAAEGPKQARERHFTGADACAGHCDRPSVAPVHGSKAFAYRWHARPARDFR